MKTKHPCFSELNDPIPDGEKTQWVSAKTGNPVETDPARIPPGFNRWVRSKPSSRGIVMMLFCTIGRHQFKAQMQWLADKCDMTTRGLRKCLEDLEEGEWVTRTENKRGGTLSGWNLFTVPHILGTQQTPDYRRNERSTMGVLLSRKCGFDSCATDDDGP